MDTPKQLRLDNQVCFPLYVASRLVIQQYQPLLHQLGVTYPQYLVLLVLWEHQKLNVGQIKELLFLDTNTLTPLLKRMEKSELLTRQRSKKDERVTEIHLTEKGQQLQGEAAAIPAEVFQQVNCALPSHSKLGELKELLQQMNQNLKKNQPPKQGS